MIDEDTGKIVQVKKVDRGRKAEPDKLLTDVFWSVNQVYLAHAAENEVEAPSTEREKNRKRQMTEATDSEKRKNTELWECVGRHSEGHQRPQLAESARLLRVLAAGLDKLTNRDGVLYDSDGKQSVFYTELLGVIDYHIVELAKEHNDRKAIELVDSLPNLQWLWEDMDEHRDSVGGYLRRVHVQDAQYFVPPSLLPERVREMTRTRRDIDGTLSTEDGDESRENEGDHTRGSTEERVEDAIAQYSYQAYRQFREETDGMHLAQYEKEKEEETPDSDHNLMVAEEKKRRRERTIVQDSGSSRDIACTTAILRDVKETEPVSLITGNGESVVNKKGQARLTRVDGSGKPVLVKKEMLYDPNVPVNIVSTGHMDHVHHRSIIHQNGQLLILKHPIKVDEDDVIVRGRLTPGLLYRWDTEHDTPLDINERFYPKERQKREKTG